MSVNSVVMVTIRNNQGLFSYYRGVACNWAVSVASDSVELKSITSIDGNSGFYRPIEIKQVLKTIDIIV